MKKFRKMIVIIVATAISLSYFANAQVSINTDGTDPDASAMLDVKSTDKGFLPPRVATVNDVSNPAEGLMVYEESTNCMRSYDGTVWSECMGKTYSCGDALIDSRDGQSYTTVQIGTQCWMAENLNIGTMINGGSNQTDNDTIEKYCYNNNTTNCGTYGGLYQWDEMMQYVTTEGTQGICPTGWHLPTDAEWCTLENYVDAGTVSCSATGWRGTDAGGNLKESGTTHWTTPNTGATNSSGFTGIPGGYRGTGSSFNVLTYSAYFWSSSEGGTGAWYRYLYYSSAQVGRNYYSKAFGFSVRCVRD